MNSFRLAIIFWAVITASSASLSHEYTKGPWPETGSPLLVKITKENFEKTKNDALESGCRHDKEEISMALKHLRGVFKDPKNSEQFKGKTFADMFVGYSLWQSIEAVQQLKDLDDKMRSIEKRTKNLHKKIKRQKGSLEQKSN